MTEDFSAELRQHLRETIDDVPGHGQYAAIIGVVAQTPQRHPLAARLTGSPERTVPFPSGAVRIVLIAAALVAAIFAGALLAGGATYSRRTIFEGTWTATDPGDASRMYLAVAPGSTPDVRFVDSVSTGTACVADTVQVFTAAGTGRIDGDRLDVRWPEGGSCGLMPWVLEDDTYAYNQATDTLVDRTSVTWTRAVDGVPLPTRGPLTSVSPGPDSVFPPSAGQCVEFTHGGTYRARSGLLSISVTVPSTPDKTWHGLRDSFYLLRAPCTFGGPWVESVSIGSVYADACHRRDSLVGVKTTAAAIAALAAQRGVEVSDPINVTVDGRPAARLDFTAPQGLDPETCDNGVIQPFHGVANDLPATAFIVDVDGTPTALVFHWFADDDAAIDATLAAEMDQIVASVHIEP